MAFDYYCVDVGTSFCPCSLAETKDCILCSILQGEETCDCNWRGICVYQEYLWKGSTIQNRDDIVVPILSKNIKGKLMTIEIEIPDEELFKSCYRVGTYVFLRSKGYHEYYNVPLCIMNVDKYRQRLVFAISIIGPKTKVLSNASHVVFKGPYQNGFLGLKHILAAKNQKCLIVGKGIGQASIILLAEQLKKQENDIIILLNHGNIGTNIAEQKLLDMGITPKINNCDEKEYIMELEELLNKNTFNLICSAGSDEQHKQILKLVENMETPIPLVISNNHVLCCGEGICGSCIKIVDDKLINLCKIQLDSKKVLGGINNG